jgi:hypothetical protein
LGWRPSEVTETVGMVANRPIWGVAKRPIRGVTKRPIRNVQKAHTPILGAPLILLLSSRRTEVRSLPDEAGFSPHPLRAYRAKESVEQRCGLQLPDTPDKSAHQPSRSQKGVVCDS